MKMILGDGVMMYRVVTHTPFLHKQLLKQFCIYTLFHIQHTPSINLRQLPLIDTEYHNVAKDVFYYIYYILRKNMQKLKYTKAKMIIKIVIILSMTFGFGFF